VTFVAIYRQLRAQHAAVAFEQVQRLVEEGRSERIRYDSLRLAVGLRRGDGWEELEQWMAIAIFFEKLAFLHREGYLNAEVLYVTFGEDVVRWWSVTAQLVEQLRVAYEHAGELAGFEGLAAQMREMMAKRGVPPFNTDPESIAGRLDWIIAGYTRKLEMDREFRSGRSQCHPGPRPRLAPSPHRSMSPRPSPTATSAHGPARAEAQNPRQRVGLVYVTSGRRLRTITKAIPLRTTSPAIAPAKAAVIDPPAGSDWTCAADLLAAALPVGARG
jgi:hypothetical protein